MLLKQLALIFLFPFFAQAVLTSEDIVVIERAYQTSEVCKYQLDYEEDYRKRTQQEVQTFYQEYLLPSYNHYLSTFGGESTDKLAALESAIIKRLKKDLTITQQLQETVPKSSQVSYSFSTNKLTLVTEGILQRVQDGYLPLLFDGTLIKQYSEALENRTFLDHKSDAENFEITTGTSQGTFFKGLLAVSYLELAKEENFLALADFFFKNPSLGSALFHATPFPKDFPMNDIPASFSWLYETQLAFPHSGYAFGGQSEDRLGNGRTWYGPYDCSSCIGQMINYPDIYNFDTLNLHNYFSSIEASTHLLASYLEICPVTQFHQIVPGMLVSWRSYNLSRDPTKEGTGRAGHIVFALGMLSDQMTLLTIERTRAMPACEGFGIRKIPLFQQEWLKDKRLSYFKILKSDFYKPE